MRKFILPLMALLGMFAAASADAQVSLSVANEAITGTTIGKLAKFTATSPVTAVIATTSDTDGVVGIVSGFSLQGSTGITGNAYISQVGITNCTFDTSGVTTKHYVIASTAAGGSCADGGATRPTGVQVIGIAQATGGSGASVAVSLDKGFANTSGAASSITPGTTTIIGATAPCLIDNSGTTVMGCAAVGTGGLTALAVNTGSAGAFAKNNGDALSGTFSGTPTFSGNFTASAVPKFTGLSAGTIAAGKNLGLDSSNNLVVATVSGGSGCTTAGTIHNLVTDDGAGGCTSDGSANATGGALSLGASGTVGTVALGNATSGTVTLGTVAGALGSVTASLPANTGTIAELNLAQSWTAKQTMTGSGPLELGANGGNVGSIKIFGNTSGDATIVVPAAAGTATRFQLPATNGSNTNVLQTDGSGNTSWVAAGGSGGALTLVTTLTASSSASLHFSSLVTANQYKMICRNLIPGTDTADLLLTFGESGTEKIASYKWSWLYTNSGNGAGGVVTSSSTGGSTDSSIHLNINTGTAVGAPLVLIDLTGLASAVRHTASFNVDWSVAPEGEHYHTTGSGAYVGDTTAITDLYIKFSTGNVASGKCSLFSYSE